MSESIKKIISDHQRLDGQIRTLLSLYPYPFEVQLQGPWFESKGSVFFAESLKDFESGNCFSEQTQNHRTEWGEVIAILILTCTGDGKTYLLFDRNLENTELKQRYENGEF